MIISKKNFNIIVPFILFVGIGTLGLFSVNYIVSERLMPFTLKWCGFPTLIFAIYYAYKGSFGYHKKVSIWLNSFSILFMTGLCSIIFLTIFQGFIILINCNIGHQKNYLMKGLITKINTKKSKSGRVIYTISLFRKIENDIVKIETNNNIYAEGDFLSKQMKIGSLGFIYSKE